MIFKYAINNCFLLQYTTSTTPARCFVLVLFDVGKAKTEEGINYDVLESIKNGWITANKYNSEQFRCHTPNIVVVFSNEKPDIKEAVKDRWKILQIKEDDLIDISKRYTNKM